MKLFTLLLWLLGINSIDWKIYAQDKVPQTKPPNDRPIIYEYKKYEKIDLGDLQIQGEILAPSDISIREKDREKFQLDLFVRKNSDDLAQRDINSVR